MPLSFLYGFAIRVRNLFFNTGVLKSHSYSFPVISVGNLSTGGTGKTPHVEYLLSLLIENYKIATLSRGYGRSTKGFLMADKQSIASQIGDEPLQYYSRYGEKIRVAVGEDRVQAINQIKTLNSSTEVIILDDAYQHRYVNPGLSILLTDFRNPFYKDYLLPAGNLREPRIGSKRADIIIVTKCADNLSQRVQKKCIDKIKPLPTQMVFFSGLKYRDPESLNNGSTLNLDTLKNVEVLLVTGIANPTSIKSFLSGICAAVYLLRFSDHHPYSREDIRFIERNFNTIASSKKIIITTEKDAMRLKESSISSHLNSLPVYSLPVQVYFLHQQKEFDQYILNYVKNN